MLSPTIFNVVVDAVLRHWVTVMVEGAEERGKCGQEGRYHNHLFYADDGMVASLEPRWLQGAFSNLVGMFDRMGLWTNVRRQSEWSSAHARRRGSSRRRRTGDG